MLLLIYRITRWDTVITLFGRKCIIDWLIGGDVTRLLSLGMYRDGCGGNKIYLLRLAISEVCSAGHTVEDIEHVFRPTRYRVADRYIMFLRVLERTTRLVRIEAKNRD